MCLFIVYFSFEFSMSSLESEIKYFLCLTHIITNQIITNNQGIAMGPTREETQRETTRYLAKDSGRGNGHSGQDMSILI